MDNEKIRTQLRMILRRATTDHDTYDPELLEGPVLDTLAGLLVSALERGARDAGRSEYGARYRRPNGNINGAAEVAELHEHIEKLDEALENATHELGEAQALLAQQAGQLVEAEGELRTTQRTLVGEGSLND